MAQWLKPTRYLNFNHPNVQQVLNSITRNCSSDQEKAVAIHEFVRTSVLFGFGPKFANYTASEVLELGVGFCNTKATLFNALLRGAGIPARQHFVGLNADVLRGFVSPGAWVDHSWTEVFLNGKWVSVDSYTVDPVIEAYGKQKLIVEKATLGYGVHIEGTSKWDGNGDAFIQCVGGFTSPDRNITCVDFGTFNDTEEFYSGPWQNGHAPFSKFSFVGKMFVAPLLMYASSSIDSLRRRSQ